MKREKLYHLTPCENAEKILMEGIKADEEGNIFTFTDMLVANAIATEQVFTKRYTVFRISRRGITGSIGKDNVAEFTAPFHRIIKQNIINPRYLSVECEEDTILGRPTAWDYLVGTKILGKTYDQIDGEFEIYSYIHDQEAKGSLTSEEILKEANRRLQLLYSE